MKLPEGAGIFYADFWFGWGFRPVASPGQTQKTKGDRPVSSLPRPRK
jgi:hypothetical protein